MKENGKQIILGIDGEFYYVKDARKIMFQVDKAVPKIKILKRVKRGEH